ncbi:Rrf2 family transcriptional regulator [Thioalkalivibrio nitratireducens]|nr:Rrf2 family transcriptional regulator [Thioalkalivibrio nitratireducens]
MKLTTKGRYAVTAMLDVAMHAEQRPVSLADVARRQHLSLSYLEQLFARLRRKGLVSSSRGPGGGYRLSRRSDAITVAEIILAVDEPVDVTRCGGQANCTHRSQCLTHDLWTDLSQQVESFLSERSLADVLHRYREARAARERVPESGDGQAAIPIAASADTGSKSR